jgi:hypothetical protein
MSFNRNQKDYFIADEEGTIWEVDPELVKEANRFGAKGSVMFMDYLGARLDKWQNLPILTRGKSFIKRGHVLARG